MSVPVRSATELAETIKYCSGLLADCAEEDGVRADILAATAALVALAQDGERATGEAYDEGFAAGIAENRTNREAAEDRVAELETAIATHKAQYETGRGSMGAADNRLWGALAAGSPTGQEQQA